MLTKLVSGGQTGVDRAALDAALAAQFACGGWAPADRIAEDGVIPSIYPLVALPGAGYRQRTRQNVIDSDGTVILYIEALTGGSRLTRNLCALEHKPYLLIDARGRSADDATELLLAFINENRIQVLNVAGPRASRWPEGHGFALAALTSLLGRLADLRARRRKASAFRRVDHCPRQCCPFIPRHFRLAADAVSPKRMATSPTTPTSRRKPSVSTEDVDMGTRNSTEPTHERSDSRQGTEAEQKGGAQPAKEHAERDFEDSPKEDGE